MRTTTQNSLFTFLILVLLLLVGVLTAGDPDLLDGIIKHVSTCS